MTDPAAPAAAVHAAISASGDPKADLLAALADGALRRAPDHVLAQPVDTIVEQLTDMLEQLTGHPLDELRVALERHDVASGRATVEVVWRDRPFLLSTITSELVHSGLEIRGTFHPILGVELDDDGQLVGFVPARTAAHRASVIQIEVTGLPEDEAAVTSLLGRVRADLEDVEVVTAHHGAMRAEVEAGAAALATGEASDAEVAALLSWLLDDNLLLLGCEATPRRGTDGEPRNLGILSDPARRARLLADVDAAPSCDDLPRLATSRTRERSSVQRQAPLEVFEVTFPDDGRDGTGRLRLLGLQTRKGIAEPVRNTPVLRRRLRQVLEAEDMVDGSHDAITLTALAHAIPKDELLRATRASFRDLLVGLLQAEQHREVAAFVRPHPPSGTVSVLVALPRERWSPELARRLRTVLSQRFDATGVEVDASIDLQRDAISRYLLELRSPDDPQAWSAQVPAAAADLDRTIADLARPWDETVVRELTRRVGARTAATIGRSIVSRLPRSYRDVTEPVDAVTDVQLLARTMEGDATLLVWLRAAPSDPPAAEPAGAEVAAPRRARAPIRLLAAKRSKTLELSSFLPILESLGLTTVDEVPHPLDQRNGAEATLHDFGIRAPGLDPATDGPRVADAILAAWRGHLEVDPLNRLVVVSRLDWFDVSILRAYRRLRRQLGTAYTPAYVDTILVSHPDTVHALVDHIHARFDPHRSPDAPTAEETRAHVLAELDQLERLDHDRILRRLLELIDATLRTNAFRPDARADDSGEPYVALKIDPSRVSDAPEPRPYREIFVHSPRVEGVHLRSGPVSRGGLRWSDRRDDVRNEVLDLVKAQVLKNAVIVPSGAKGGFVLTREPEDPGDAPAEARRQYVTFVRGLLDITDDLEADRVVPPPEVVRHDGDDPYLVVAADRGTATFSDLANEVAARYGFWLDDAFASGGEHGYDHKRHGVTAKGAWVAISAHFRELDVDVSTDPISVTGIGDMSGDVFGNGLLRSRSVRLVAAFDHRHIFLDPDPDPELSFAERQRLYDLPGSSWGRYDRRLLSPGAMIVPRAAKRVALSDEVRGLLRIDDAELTPPELIRAILRAPVDLLFAGGIGTYIRATAEPESELGDRANADVRVEASTVRARVIGEGANLALTQPARIELARRGTRLNQDAIDNAAGVATSDLEVNLKILLRLAEERGRLDREGRNQLLEDLSEEVVDRAVDLVASSCAAISRELDRSPRSLEHYDQLLRRLETETDLDREAECLPTTDELTVRAEADAGLSRPELASLMAWAKRELKEALLASEVPDAPLLRPALDRSLPAGAVARFGDLLEEHRLRRELITTVVVNTIVDRLGVTVASRLAAEAGVELTVAVQTIQAAIHIVDAERWWTRLDALDSFHDPARRRELELPLEELVVTLARVLLTDPTAPEPVDAAQEQRPIADHLLAALDGLGTRSQRRARSAHARWLADDLVEPDLARLLAAARDLTLVPDVAAVRQHLPAHLSEAAVADALLQLSDRLGVDRLEDTLRRLDVRSNWARRERLGLSMDLRRARRAAVVAMLSDTAEDRGEPPGTAAAVERWLESRREHLERARETVAAAASAEQRQLDALGVAARAIRETVERRPQRPVS
ncbi:MAG: NAD-glutamate dehydrogenase [Nitriliruptoraceae bacterium]